jgi:hypothetical protein
LACAEEKDREEKSSEEGEKESDKEIKKRGASREGRCCTRCAALLKIGPEENFSGLFILILIER